MDSSLQPRVRPFFIRPQNPQDWEPYKDWITALYATMELNAVIESMKKEHNFAATIGQYKKQLPKWGLDKKRVKAAEYETIIRKRKHRQERGKESEVFLRGEVVLSRNIERYERNKIRKLGSGKQMVDPATPPNLDLMIRTPPPAGSDLSGPSMSYDQTPSRSMQAYGLHSDFASSQEHQEVRVDSEVPSMTSIKCPACNPSPGAMETYLTRSPSPFNEPWSSFFLQSQYYRAGSPSLLTSETSPVIALLKKESGVLHTFQDEAEFQREFRSLFVEHDCFGCRTITFLSKNIREFAYNSSHAERIKSFIEAALFYALKPGACNPERSLQAQECLNASIEGMKASKVSRNKTAMCDLARYYCTQGKEGFAVPLIKELLGHAYRGALWFWRHATSVDGFCCRCRRQIAPKLTGTECLDSCQNCIADAKPEVLGCFCTPCLPRVRNNSSADTNEIQLHDQWNTFYAFLLLGLSKRFTIVDMDDPNDDSMELGDESELADWDVPCAKGHPDHGARCTAIIRPQDYLLYGRALSSRHNPLSLWVGHIQVAE